MRRSPRLAFQLRRLLLEEAGNIDHEITAAELAEATGLSRQRIYALLDGQKIGGLQLKVLGRLCLYLVEQGVQSELPGSLFMFQTVSEVVRRSARINTYVPLYKPGDTDEPASRTDPISSWISPRDARVHDLLSHWWPMERSTREMNLGYVCHESRPGEPATEAESVELWRKVSESKLATNIIIGSFLVNNLAEQMLADLCNLKPWEAPSEQVPFMMLVNKGRKDYIHGIGWRESEQQGIRYRPLDSEEWVEQAFLPNRIEGGVIMTRYDSKRGTLDIALMGITGRATLALGRFITTEEAVNAFWPYTPARKEGDDSQKEGDDSQYVGIWVCDIQYDPDNTDKEDHVKVTPTRVM